MFKSYSTNKIQYFALFGSVIITIFIVELIRKKKLKEEYSLLWLFFSGLFILFSFWRRGIDLIAKLLGVSYPPAAAFILLFTAILSILIHYSIVISKLTENVKNLVQEIGILKYELKKIKEYGRKK